MQQTEEYATIDDSIHTEIHQEVRTRRILVLVALALLVAALFFAYQQITYTSSQIHKAEKYFSEFKDAKGLEELLKAKSKHKKAQPELDFLIAYAYINAKDYNNGEKLIPKLGPVPHKLKSKFIKTIQVLNYNDKPKLIISLVPKAQELQTQTKFFFKASRARSSIDEELQILEAGHGYLRKSRPSAKATAELTQLENHLLRRYLEIANIYIGNREYTDAVSYLSKANELEVTANSPYKSELHLNLGLAYKSMRKYSDAWNHIKIAAKLGNGRARTMLASIQKNYVP